MRFLVFLAFAVSAICSAQAGDVQASDFVGRWEHRFSPDLEGDILSVRLEGGLLKGEYLGLEREGEHGLFYSAIEVKNLEVVNGEIRFIVPRRDYYVKRPRNSDQAKAWAKSASGGTNEELQFYGRFNDGALDLTCASKFGGCPDKKMKFQNSKVRPNNKFQRTPAGAAEQ